MSKSTQSTRNAQSDQFDAIIDRKAVRYSVFALSGAVAVATAVFNIWREFYDQIKHEAPFKYFRDAKQRAEDASNEQVLAKAITPEEGRALKHAANRTYTEELAVGMRELGIPKGLFQGTIARARELGAYNINSIVMRTGASLAVTLGGYFLLDQNMRMKANNTQQDERLRDLRDRIDAQEARRIEAFERTQASR